MRTLGLWFATAAAGFFVWPGTATGQMTEPPPGIESGGTVPATDVDRFEGYLYLDIEGNPLPIQSDEDIERFLAEAEIVESSALGIGITLPRKLVLQGDGFRAHAVFKDVDDRRHKVTERINGRNHFSLDWRDWHGYDVAAYVVDRLLGLDRTPPAVFRRVRGDSGTIRIWLEGTVTENERASELKVSPPDPGRWTQQRSMMQVFDDLVANRDSNLGNLLIDPNWRAWFIDCTRCFGNTKAIYFPLDKISYCERGMWQGLVNLDPSEAEKRLSPILGKKEIKAFLARRDMIVRHFQNLIDEHGEDKVLFDVNPAMAVAPWAGN